MLILVDFDEATFADAHWRPRKKMRRLLSIPPRNHWDFS
jgi:hypothetical protein